MEAAALAADDDRGEHAGQGQVLAAAPGAPILNERQRKVLNRLLDAGRGGFEGGLTTRKYVGLTKTSRATAYRELAELVVKGLSPRGRTRAGAAAAIGSSGDPRTPLAPSDGPVYDAAVFERLVWLVPAIVVAVGIARPRAALVALAASLPFFGASRGGPYLAALDAACLAAILLSLRERRPERTGLDLAVLAFAAVGVASFFPLVYHPPSWQPPVLGGLAHALANAPTWSGLFTWRALLDLLLGCGLYFSTRRAFGDRSARPLALGLAGGLGVLVLLGLAEYAGAIDLGATGPWPPRGACTRSSPTRAGSGSTS